MSRWFLSEGAAQDLESMVDFLLERFPEEAGGTTDLILSGLHILSTHPLVGRVVAHGLRELVISRGRTGYLALYEYDAALDVVVVLAVKHQREQGYH